MGNNSRPARMNFMELGLTLIYGPRTVIGACGQVLKHGVDSWGEGDRICYTHFMRDKVRARFDVEPGGWVTQGLYASSLSEKFREHLGFT